MKLVCDLVRRMWRVGIAVACSLVSAVAAQPSRPQDPKPPYPYQVQEVTFQGANTQILHGVVTRPINSEDSSPRSPAVILLSASGAHDRNNTIAGHRTFLVLADYLTRKGYVVLRFDNRGYGLSPGARDSTSLEYSHDAEAALEFLRSQKYVDPKRIGLVGHSEGGLIAALLTARRQDIALVLVLGMSFEDLAETLVAQAESVRRGAGSDQAAAKRNADYSRRMVTIAKLPSSPERDEKMTAEMEAIREEAGESAAWSKGQLAFLNARWTQFALREDPKTSIAKISVPIVAIWGTKDSQVVPERQLAIVDSLNGSRKCPIRTQLIPNVNHILQPSTSGSVLEYAKNEISVSPDLMGKVAEWLDQLFASRSCS